MLLPHDPHYDHTTIAVSAWQEGEVAGRYLLLGVGVFAGRGAPAEAYFDDLEVTRR